MWKRKMNKRSHEWNVEHFIEKVIHGNCLCSYAFYRNIGGQCRQTMLHRNCFKNVSEQKNKNRIQVLNKLQLTIINRLEFVFSVFSDAEKGLQYHTSCVIYTQFCFFFSFFPGLLLTDWPTPANDITEFFFQPISNIIIIDPLCYVTNIFFYFPCFTGLFRFPDLQKSVHQHQRSFIFTEP